jgi:polyhydroxybutyrate depolymerase
MLAAGFLAPRAIAQSAADPVVRSWADSVWRVQVGDQTRIYGLHRHHIEQAHGPVPIIIYLHGAGQLVTDPVLLRYDIPFGDLPDLEPALIVSPQAADRRWDAIPGSVEAWQRRSGLDGEQVDDIGFLRAVIDDVIAREHGDPSRVYVAGVSSGGFMAARVACELADRVTAVADIIATMYTSQLIRCDRARPIPFLLLASTTDPTNSYVGWRGNEATGLASAVDTVALFAGHNHCTARTEEGLPHLADVPSTVTLARYSGCAGGAEVLFYRVDGSGHSVPSTLPPEPGGWRENGARNRDFDTARVVWSFFSRHRLGE